MKRMLVRAGTFDSRALKPGVTSANSGEFAGRAANVNEGREKVAERISRLLSSGCSQAPLDSLRLSESWNGVCFPLSRPGQIDVAAWKRWFQTHDGLLEGILNDDPQLSLVWQAIDLALTGMAGRRPNLRIFSG